MKTSNDITVSCSTCYMNVTCDYREIKKSKELFCSSWSLKSCRICRHLKSCPYRNKLSSELPEDFSCYKWGMIPYKVTLIDGGQKLTDFHECYPDLLKLEDISLNVIVPRIPDRINGTEVEVIRDINRDILLIYIRELRGYAFIKKNGVS